MATWAEFAAAAPEMAAAGRALLYQFGPGLGYLATVRKDGGPRLHPFCPTVAEGGIFGLIIPSPKQGDLLRDGRYAIHSFPKPDSDDEFYLAGTARRVDDAALRAAVLAAYLSTGATSEGHETFFEFDIERALLAIYPKRGEGPGWPPAYTKWRDPAVRRRS
ncbi:MAG: hypothetical protein HY875_13285 [Chloroflexi bacterium]|nr:hypothetical protein [Chloroflexota bacterium]